MVQNVKLRAWLTSTCGRWVEETKSVLKVQQYALRSDVKFDHLSRLTLECSVSQHIEHGEEYVLLLCRLSGGQIAHSPWSRYNFLWRVGALGESDDNWLSSSKEDPGDQ